MTDPPLAVTIQGFLKLIEDNGGRSAFVGKPTRVVVDEIVMKITERQGHEYGGVSVVEHIQEKYRDLVQLADWYVSHAWDDQFLDTVDALVHFCEEQQPTKDLALWFCVFNNNQHKVKKDGKKAGSTNLLVEFESALTSTGRLVMVMHPWYHPLTVTRIWCVYEVFVAEKNSIPFKAAMGKQPKADFLMDVVGRGRNLELFEAMLTNIDSETAKGNEDDRKLIKAAIKSQTSFNALDVLVSGVLIRWIRAELVDATNAQPNPLVQASFKHALAYASLLETADASRLYIEEMDLLFHILGEFDPNRVAALGLLSFVHGGSDILWQNVLHAAAAYAEIYGPNHDRAIELLQFVANRFVARKDYTRAKATLNLMLQHLSNENEIAKATKSLIEVQCLEFDFAACEPVAQDCYNRMMDAYGPNHIFVIAVGQVLVKCYVGLGKFEQAVALQAKELAFCERALGGDVIQATSTRAMLMEAYARANMREDVKKVARDLLLTCATTPSGMFRTQELAAEGMLCVLEHHPAAAASLYLDAYEAAEMAFGADNPISLALCSRMYMTAFCTATDVDKALAKYHARPGPEVPVLFCALCGYESPDVLLACQLCYLDAVCVKCHQEKKAACRHGLDNYTAFLVPACLANLNVTIAMGVMANQTCCAPTDESAGSRTISAHENVTRHWDVLRVVAVVHGKSHRKTHTMLGHVVDLALDCAKWDVLHLLSIEFPTVPVTSRQAECVMSALASRTNNGQPLAATAVAAALNVLLQVGTADVIETVGGLAETALVDPATTDQRDDIILLQVIALLCKCLAGMVHEMNGCQEGDQSVQVLLPHLADLVEKPGANRMDGNVVAHSLYTLYALFTTSPDEFQSRWQSALVRVLAAFLGHSICRGEAWVTKSCGHCNAALRGDVHVKMAPQSSLPFHQEWFCDACWTNEMDGCASSAVVPIARFVVTPRPDTSNGMAASDAYMDYCMAQNVSAADLDRAVQHLNGKILANESSDALEFRLQMAQRLILAEKAALAEPLIHDTHRYVEDSTRHDSSGSIRRKWRAQSLGHRAVIEWKHGDRGRAIQGLVDAVELQTEVESPDMLNAYMLYQMLSKSPVAPPQAALAAIMRLARRRGMESTWIDVVCCHCSNTLDGPVMTCSCCDDVGTFVCSPCRWRQVHSGEHTEYTLRSLIPLAEFVLERQYMLAQYSKSPSLSEDAAAYASYCDANEVPAELQLHPDERPGYLTSVDAPLEKGQRERVLAVQAHCGHWFEYFALYCAYDRYCAKVGIPSDRRMRVHTLPPAQLARIQDINKQVVAAFTKSPTCTYWQKTLDLNYRQLSVFLGRDDVETHRTLDLFVNCAITGRQWRLLLGVIDETVQSSYDFTSVNTAFLLQQWRAELKPGVLSCENLSVAYDAAIGICGRLQDRHSHVQVMMDAHKFAFKELNPEVVPNARPRRPESEEIIARRRVKTAALELLIYQSSLRLGIFFSINQDDLAMRYFEAALNVASPANCTNYHQMLCLWYRLRHRTQSVLDLDVLILLEKYLDAAVWTSSGDEAWQDSNDDESWRGLRCQQCGGPLVGVVFVVIQSRDLEEYVCTHCWKATWTINGPPPCQIAMSPPRRFLLERQVATADDSTAQASALARYQAYCRAHAVPEPEQLDLRYRRLTATTPLERLSTEVVLGVLARHEEWEMYTAVYFSYKTMCTAAQQPGMYPHAEFPAHGFQHAARPDVWTDTALGVAKLYQVENNPTESNALLFSITSFALATGNWDILRGVRLDFPAYGYDGVDGSFVVRMLEQTNPSSGDKLLGLYLLRSLRAFHVAAPFARAVKAAPESDYLLYIACMMLGFSHALRQDFDVAVENFATAFNVLPPTSEGARSAFYHMYFVQVYADLLDTAESLRLLSSFLERTGLADTAEFAGFLCDGCDRPIQDTLAMCLDCMSDQQYCVTCVVEQRTATSPCIDSNEDGHDWTLVTCPSSYLYERLSTL